MPTKKNKVRDLKPQKDAKGGGGGSTQGVGNQTGGNITPPSIDPPGYGGKGGKIEDPRSTQ